jgi:hypothetical protein
MGVKQDKFVAIYFDRSNGVMFKELAKRVRSSKVADPSGGQRNLRPILNWASNFRGPEDMQACAAVIIQRGCVNANIIAECYKAFGSDIELHWVTEHGEFESERPADGGAAPAGTDPSSEDADPEQPESADEPVGSWAGEDDTPATD